MTREEVIQFLLDTGVTPKNVMKFVEALSNHTDAAIQKMQDLEQAEIQKAYEIGKAEGSSEWIFVNERVPKTEGVYIVTRKLFDNQIDTEPYYMVDACYFDGSNTWHNDNRINHERNYLTDIIAWMPLPESYKAESEVQK